MRPLPIARRSNRYAIDPQPLPDAVASPAAPGEVEHSSEVEMTPEEYLRQSDERRVSDRRTVDPVQRLKWLPIYMGEGIPYRCSHCHLMKDDHVRDGITLWCAEWRLRQMYGDR